MTYSSWNDAARVYDYYEAPAPAHLGPPDPTHLKSRPLGVTPKQAAWPLPRAARLVGRGQYARGYVVATPGQALGEGPAIDRNLVGIAGFGLAAYLLWRIVEKDSRR